MNFNLFKRKESPMKAVARVDAAIQDKIDHIARDIVWATKGIGGERKFKYSPAFGFITKFDCHAVQHFKALYCLNMSEQPIEQADFCLN